MVLQKCGLFSTLFVFSMVGVRILIFILALLFVSSKPLKYVKHELAKIYSDPVDQKCNIEIVSDLRCGKSKVSKIEKSESLFSSLLKKIYKFFEDYLPSSLKSEKRYGKKHLPKKKRMEQLDTSAIDNANRRIQKELQSFLADPPDNCELTVGNNIRSWVITLTGVTGTIFSGEKYKLQVKFPKDYPTKPPSVYFLKPCPKHVHVYSNGDICLNLLGRDWRPTMTVQGIAVSILSMLSSAKEKSMPQDNALHAESAPGQQQDNWMYHDDKC